MVWICGMVGSVLDSLMGALFQAKYRAALRRVDRTALGGRQPFALGGGFSWMNNDVINFLSILFCGALSTAFTGL